MLKVVLEDRRFKNIFNKSMFSPVTFDIWKIGHILQRERIPESNRRDESVKNDNHALPKCLKARLLRSSSFRNGEFKMEEEWNGRGCSRINAPVLLNTN